MIRNLVLEMIEPECRHLIQHLSLVGNGRGQHHIEGGKPVGDDNEEAVSKIVNVPDLATSVQWNARKIRLNNVHQNSNSCFRLFQATATLAGASFNRTDTIFDIPGSS